MTVGDIMRCIYNYFEQGYRKTTFNVEGAKLQVEDEAFDEFVWVAIAGSSFHDGVWHLKRNGAIDGLSSETDTDEEFTGKVYYLAPTHDFLDLCEEIIAYCDENPDAGADSVKIGNYSESGTKGWKEAFAGRLNVYKRNPLECEIRV